MATRFRLQRKDLYSKDPPVETELTLTQIMGVPGHWSDDDYVPLSLIQWAALPHKPGDFSSVCPCSSEPGAVAPYRYQLTQISD